MEEVPVVDPFRNKLFQQISNQNIIFYKKKPSKIKLNNFDPQNRKISKGNDILLENFDDKLYILECANEIQKASKVFTPENYLAREKNCNITEEGENYTGILKKTNKKNIKNCFNNENDKTLCTYNERLEYKSLQIQNQNENIDCNEISSLKFWNGHKEFFIEKINSIPIDKTPIFLFVSHHHKLKKILPIRNDSPKNGYANCFCLKLTLDKLDNEQIVIKSKEIVFQGYKDKKKYNYIETNDINDINLSNIFNGENLQEGFDRKFIIYIIRHGNSLHNAPTKTKRLDSVLTPKGIFEAFILGNKIKRNLYPEGGANLNPYYVCCSSFLNRAQLTCLTTFFGLYLPWNKNKYLFEIFKIQYIKDHLLKVKLFYLFVLFIYLGYNEYFKISFFNQKTLISSLSKFIKSEIDTGNNITKKELQNFLKFYNLICKNKIIPENNDCINLINQNQEDENQVNENPEYENQVNQYLEGENLGDDYLFQLDGGTKYIKLKKYGKRKIHYYKNGKPYIIIKGRKKKI